MTISALSGKKAPVDRALVGHDADRWCGLTWIRERSSRARRVRPKADARSLDQPQTSLADRLADVVGEHRAVVVEAVETAGETADPSRDLVRGPVACRLGDDVG